MKKPFSITLVLSLLVVAAAIGAYLLVLRPQADKVGRLDEDVAALETQLKAASELAKPGENPELPIKVADLVELAKAMPDDSGVADAILELDSAAQGAGVQFIAISPGVPTTGAGFTQLPLTLSFEGNYYNLTDLVYRIRNLVSVRDGVLDARGRLFTIDSLDWFESEGGFPTVQADLVVSAYVYGVDSVPVLTPGALPTTPAQTTTDQAATTPATTTGATTTAPEPTTTAPAATTSGAPDASQQAAGVNP